MSDPPEPSRRPYHLLMGIATGALLTGLVLPFAAGDRHAPGPAALDAPLDSGSGADVELAPTPASPRADEGAAAPGSAARAVVDPSPSGGAPAESRTAPARVPRGTGGAGEPTRRSSDVGVTPDTIRLGFMLIDVGGLDQIGFAVGITVEQQQAAVAAYVEELNERGGIRGRRVVPVYRPVNVLSNDDGRAGCLELAQDGKVFAASGNVSRAQDALCFAREFGMPLLASNQFPDRIYADGRGLVTSLQMRGGRLMRNWVAELDRVGYLGTRKVGIVTSEQGDPNGETAAQLRRFLEAAGHPVVRVTRLAFDLHTGSSQIPVEVNQMRAAGAEAVLLMANTLFNQQWVQQADGQAWRPRYSVSGWSNSDNDGSTDNMPASYEGTVGFTSIWPGLGTEAVGPEPPPMRACREVYERRSGRRLEPGTNEFGVTMVYCDLVKVLAAQIAAAGVNPTRAAVPAATATVSGLDPLGWMRGGSLGAGKPDVVDYLRLHRWSAGCRCYQAVEPFRRMPY